MRIALLVNNPYRDLTGLTLLAGRLCAEGATCYLTPGDGRRDEINALAPDFVLLSALRRTKQDMVREWMEAGIQMGVLDSEGGVLSSFEWYGDSLATDAELRAQVKCYCSWGNLLAVEAVKRGWYRQDQIEVTGAPRFDFYAPPLSAIQLPGSPDSQKYSRPVVLINGKFSMANPATSTPEKQTHQRLSKMRGYDSEHARQYLETQTRGLHEMAALTNHVAARFPQITFIYRPHPFEKLETYHQLLKPRENLHLIREGEIQGWLRIASAVVQRSCTTAIEAGMMNLPALSPDWVSMPDHIESVEAVSIHCANQEELDAHLIAACNGSLEPPTEIVSAHERVINDWFFKIDGHSHVRVADAILRHADSSAVDLEKCRALINASNDKPEGGIKIFDVLRRNKTQKREETARREWEQSQKYFGPRQIESLIQAIAATGVITRDLNIRSAFESSEYRLPIAFGRSVVLSPR